jgi:hypothetical protein
MRTRAAAASVGDADPVTEQFACHGIGIFTELIDDGWQVLGLCETDDPVARGTFPKAKHGESAPTSRGLSGGPGLAKSAPHEGQRA